MKLINITAKNEYSIILQALIAGIILMAMAAVAYGASSPSTPSKKAGSAETLRMEANVFFNEAKVLQDRKEYRPASKKYHQAVKSDPSYAEAFSNLGYCYRKLGSFKKAVKYYKKAISLDPNLAEAHEYLGEAYAEMKKFDKAEEELRILRELGSEEADELEAFIKDAKAQGS